MMNMRRRLSALLLAGLLLIPFSCVSAEGLTPLDMDSTVIAPAPKDENYLSDYEYKDESIHVVIDEGVYDGIHYTCAYVKIADPSQLRTVPAAQANNPKAVFANFATNATLGRRIAQAANAVVAINGDYISITRVCHIAMRQGKQIRNMGKGYFDVLVINRDGDFEVLPECTKKEYAAYCEEHADSMYQSFCFGPLLVQDGKSVVPENYKNTYIIADKLTQRVALCQIGPLEYAIITCDGDASAYSFGMDVLHFSHLCEELGARYSPDGFKIAYNLDGGNSATLIFKQRDEDGNLIYQKLNMPERERDLADMICFVTLVP